jgi:hypothetical protein
MITGGCLCGAVRYSASADPIFTRVCWCRVCQRNVALPGESLSLTGALTEYASIADSGAVRHRGFCPVCGTPVTSRSESRPQVVNVRAGTLDDPEVARPAMTIWTDAAPSWACIAEDLPRMAGQPPPPGHAPSP